MWDQTKRTLSYTPKSNELKAGDNIIELSFTTSKKVTKTQTIKVSASNAVVRISGNVKTASGIGISGVMMGGLPNNPNTDVNGYYSSTVDYGWSGTVNPTKAGYTFNPINHSYTNITYDQPVDFIGIELTGVELFSNLIPDHFDLFQNYPNPFNPSTVIKFSLPQQEFAQLKIYDLAGSEIASLVSESLSAGSYQVTWNARGVSSGIYIYQIHAGKYANSKKFILLK